MKRMLFFSLALISISPLHSQSKLGKLAPLIGKWEGTATAYFPREKGKKPRVESVLVDCRSAMKGTYVECSSTWTEENGQSRELRTFFNFDQKKNFYDILYLYDNWAGKVNYALYFDPSSKTFSGSDYFMAKGTIQAEEKVTWKISDDGMTVEGNEFNHYDTDKADYWPKTFEFTWRKVK